MSYFAANYESRFRPLRAGIGIYHPRSGEHGTIGLLARRGEPDGAIYLVTAYHVFTGRSDGTPAEGWITQPPSSCVEDYVAEFVDGAPPTDLDCAMCRVRDDVACIADIYALGRLAPPRQPVVGMKVFKSGLATGVTEGEISAVSGAEIQIQAEPGLCADHYVLSEAGDSGALWVERSTRAPVALHVRGADSGGIAFASSLIDVLQRLGVVPLA